MREVIHIQGGGCGNKISANFWETITAEHQLTPSGIYEGNLDLELDKLSIFFKEGYRSRFFPRAILFDSEPTTIESILAGPYSKLYSPDSIITGNTGTGNYYAKGYLSKGTELRNLILDRLRKEAEECDCLQGFQIVHSIGGGTGSGMISRLLKDIKNQFYNKITETYTVFPSNMYQDTVVEPYNAVLSLAQMKEYADIVHVIDNE